jgi:hypothetical protein
MPEPQPHQATPVALMAQAQSEDLVRLPYKRAALLRVLIVDTDFVLVFADGRKVLIRDGAMQATARRGYKIVLQEEELSGDALIGQAEILDDAEDTQTWTTPAELMSSSDAQAQPAAVEPPAEIRPTAAEPPAEVLQKRLLTYGPQQPLKK